MKTLSLTKNKISCGFRCRLYDHNRNEVQGIELHHLDGITFQRSGKVEDNDWFMQNNSAEFIVDGDNFFICENGTRHDAESWFYHCHLDGDLGYDAIYINR